MTGAAGFIGSHLAERLLVDEEKLVVGIDDLSMGDKRNFAPWSSAAFSTDVPPRPRFKFIEGSLNHAVALPGDFDVIFHLAGRLGVEQILDNPLQMLTEHVTDAVVVCERALKCNAVVVLASSSEVYGASTAIPFVEDKVLSVGPSDILRSGYAVSKLMVEHIGLAYAKQHGLRVVVARLFNVAGPRQRANKGCVIPRFVTAALRGENLMIHGIGQQSRCFTHVDDTVRALIELSRCEEAYSKVVNIGATTPRAIADVANDIRAHVEDAYGIKSGLNYTSMECLNPEAGWSLMQTRVPSVERLRSLIGWAPEDRWSDIVRDTCAYWADRLSTPRKEEECPTQGLSA